LKLITEALWMASRRAAEMSRQRWRGDRDGSSWNGLSGGVRGAKDIGNLEGWSRELMLATGMYNEEKAAWMDLVV
jgi:hypothetical protein